MVLEVAHRDRRLALLGGGLLHDDRVLRRVVHREDDVHPVARLDERADAGDLVHLDGDGAEPGVQELPDVR